MKQGKAVAAVCFFIVLASLVLINYVWFVGRHFCMMHLWCQTIRAGTEETTRDIVEGCEGVASGLGHDNAMCLSGTV